MANAVLVVNAGLMDYQEAWDLQKAIRDAIIEKELPDVVLFVEHFPVYTVGRGARGSFNNLVWDDAMRHKAGISLFEVDRGGDITYHGPGQLVGYPIINLNRHMRDLHWYLRQLEESIILTLSNFDIISERMPPHTGVWIGNEKVAAIGVKASRWVTQHGFALNVDPNMEHFLGIVPCGISEKGVTSMKRILKRPISVSEVAPVLVESLIRVFKWDARKTVELSEFRLMLKKAPQVESDDRLYLEALNDLAEEERDSRSEWFEPETRAYRLQKEQKDGAL